MSLRGLGPLVAAALLAGCTGWRVGGGTRSDAADADAQRDDGLDADAGDAGDAPGPMDAMDAGDTPGTMDAPRPLDAPDAADAPGPIDAPDADEPIERLDVADAIDAADAIDVADAIDAADARDAIGLDAADGDDGAGSDARDGGGADAGDVSDAGPAACGVDPAAPATWRSCPTGATEPGCALVSVPAGGPFTLGQLGIDPFYRTLPRQTGVTTTQDLWVDAYEVTVARFRRFWDAGAPAPTAGPIAYPGGRSIVWEGWTVDAPDTASGCNWTPAAAPARDPHPMNCVSWRAAMAFCVWDGGRLATTAEWEWITRSRPVAGTTPPRSYPWGEARPVVTAGAYCDRAQLADCPGDDGLGTRRVGSFPDGAAGCVFDLSGNVAEWLADVPQAYAATGTGCWSGAPGADPLCNPTGSAEAARTVSGGGWTDTDTLWLYPAARSVWPYDERQPQIGFRCVRARP